MILEQTPALTRTTQVFRLDAKAVEATSSATRTTRTTAPVRRRKGWRRAALVTAFGVLAAGSALGYNTVTHVAGTPAASAPAVPEAVRIVRVASTESTPAVVLTLPASVQAYQATELQARVAGYLKRWLVDRGDHVRAGQLLAEIDTPELDQELRRAEAALVQSQAEVAQSKAELEEAHSAVTLAEANVERARAHMEYARVHLDRSRKLLARNSVSREELDESAREHDARQAEVAASLAELAKAKSALTTHEAVIASRQAAVGSSEAEVHRLRELQGFKSITAPFDGVVTRRDAETGMLVTIGTGAEVRSLFHVAQHDRLRVRVAVPQANAATVKVGDEAQLRVPEHPGRTFTAKVARTTGAVDPASRTLTVELELPNAEGMLLPGSYAQVDLHASRSSGGLTVPANVLLMRTTGPAVALVDHGTIRLKDVRLGHDLGARVEVQEGLQGRETLVINPTDDLRDGERVTVGNGERPANGPVATANR